MKIPFLGKPPPADDPARAHLRDPKIARAKVLERTALQQSLREIAEQKQIPFNTVEKEAAACARELIPGTSHLGYRLLIRMSQFIYRRGYDEEIACDPAEVERLRELTRNYPVAMVSNHRAQVDGFAVYAALHDNDLPHPYAFGGINMKLPILGHVLQRGGLIFIRRSFQDNPVYKAVLKAYIDFLVENRFLLLWAIEGSRSRTGKLSAPRFGLLNWVLDAQLRVMGEELQLVPVAVSYDQIADVQSYSAELRGAKKKPETFGWLVKYLAGFKTPLGQISVRFGEPLSVQHHMEKLQREQPQISADQDKLLLNLVIAACLNLNRVTPVTGPSMVCLLLLQAAPRAVTYTELERGFNELGTYVKAHQWPTSFKSDRVLKEVLEETLEALRASGVIECFDGGVEPVWSISAGKDLSASYYRNNSIHFMVPGAMAELALTKALAEQDPSRRQRIFSEEILHLRRIFKFEFYFPPVDELQAEIAADLDLRCPGWQDVLLSQSAHPGKDLGEVRPLLCHGVLEPFVDAYLLVAANLVKQGSDSSFEQSEFVERCLGEAEQLYRLGRLRHQASVAKNMFETGLLVAQNRGLLDSKAGEELVKSKRGEFLSEVKQLVARLQIIRHISSARRSAPVGSNGNGV